MHNTCHGSGRSSMHFDYADEFPHVVVVLQFVEGTEDELGNVQDGEWLPLYDAFACFIDTPSATEKYNAMQIKHQLDRYMYYAYGADIKPNTRIRFEGVEYEVETDAEDQGGMHEIMRVALKRVS